VNRRRRVAITGIGAVTALGVGRAVLWRNLLDGRRGISRIEAFETEQFDFHLAGEIKGFQAGEYVRRQDPADLGRASQLAVTASLLALADCGFSEGDVDPRRVGVSLGTVYGEQQEIERFDDHRISGVLERQPQPKFVTRYPAHRIAAHVAAEFLLEGPAMVIAGACAAGNYAIARAYDLIRSGRVDMMITGGTSALSRVTLSGFSRMGAMAPERCQPFDLNRKGMTPGEGAGILILEPLEAALRNGSNVYAEVAGYGLSCDANNMMAPHPNADGAVSAMANALRQSELPPDAVDYISAHGTGTRPSDYLETVAIKKIFGRSAYKIPISSIKSMLGHTEGAAAAIEAAVCALAIREGVVPPTVGLEQADPACDLDYVPQVAREVKVAVAMNNAYGFGGCNSSLLLKACIP
jgi:3-oxoacyl-[acyl-carrier-protein] synthase II